MTRLLPAIFAPILALSAGSCRQDDEAGRVPPPLVRTVTLGSGLDGKRHFTGVIRARTESSLGFRVSGKVLERLVDSGQTVSRGQPLLRLDRTDFQLALNSARAAVEAARALMTKTSNDERRSRQLADAGWVSQQGYDLARATADTAAAQFAVAEAQAAQVDNQLGYTELKADADGVITEITGEPGQVVSAGMPLVKLARSGPREAEIFLPEGSEGVVGLDATARLFTGRESFPAEMREVAAISDPLTRTYRARFVLSGAGERAPLGATVTIELGRMLRGTTETREVPLGAIFDRGEGTAVWKIDTGPGTVHAEPVVVTGLGTESARIRSDLADEDRIVALGAHLLKEGQRVRLMPEQIAGAVP